jgi:sigma-B regulation protein RsbU (phosphoserine phosphatase)
MDEGGFTERDLDFFMILSSHCAIAIENARLNEMEIREKQTYHEIETAKLIQSKFLPNKIPQFKDLDIAVRLVQAKQIGGDYFNIIKLNERFTFFMVADVAGKSISAALIVSTIYSYLQTYLILNKSGFNLIKFVVSLNIFLNNCTTVDKFVSAWFGLYDHKKKVFESLNAGHNPIFLVKKDNIVWLQEGGLLLGNFDMGYTSEKLKVEKGDMIFFYTDGITETLNKNLEEFGQTKLEIALAGQNSNPANMIVDNIINEVYAFKNSSLPDDDLTCGVIRFK